MIAALLFGARASGAETIADSNTIHTGRCTRTSAGRQITLEIEPKPVMSMRELTFRVTIEPCDRMPSSLLLDLAMPGMAMGNNQVNMSRRQNSCIWEGKGVIVRCMSGRTLWKTTLLYPELGNPAFTFNVRN